MSQRGGDVQSHLRISDKPISSDLIPQGQADLILSVEPMESLRYLPFLSKKGWLVTNTIPFENIPTTPPLTKSWPKSRKVPNHIALDADAIAKDIGSIKSSNIVMLGQPRHSSIFPSKNFRRAFANFSDEKVMKW